MRRKVKDKKIEVRSEALDWVEKQAMEGMKERAANADAIAKECVTTLTVLFAGIGASSAFAIKQLEAAALPQVFWPTLAVTAYLLVLAAVLVWKCMMFESFPAIYNEPEKLQYGEMDLGMLRRRELRGIQERIADAARIVERRASILNKIRLAAIGSPLVFILVAVWVSL